MALPLTVNEINLLDGNEFITKFGNVVECWPAAASHVVQTRPIASRAQLILLFQTYLSQLIETDQVRILQLHPDLAGRLASEGKLTEESTLEQQSAGLDRLSADELQQLQTLNQQYLERFGFPFVICVRQTNRIGAILAGLRQRLTNGRVDEVRTGIEEVKKICGLRLEQLVQAD